jgi:hypothetical protein
MSIPAQRTRAAFAVDPATGVGVLHGGRTPSTWPLAGIYCYDEWVFDAGRWRQPIGPRAALPPPGEGHQLLVDDVRNRLLLVGGFRTEGSSGEEYSIWQYEQGVWCELVHAAAPGPVPSSTAYAYDAFRDRIVAFCISTPFGPASQTWEWDWSRWILMAPGTSPPARFGGALCYDGARRRTVLFGGNAPPATVFNDTWEWDGSNWQQVVAVPAPRPRTWAGSTYDPLHARMLLVGGQDQDTMFPTRFRDLWSYDASGWTQLATSGVPARSAAMVAYDARRQRLLMLGGTQGPSEFCGDLWEWDGTLWRQAARETVPNGTLVTDWARGRILAVRGDGLVCERQGDGWVVTSGASVLPPARSLSAVAHDILRARTILFGGDDSRLLDDTWTWDGAAWSHAQPAARPSPRRSAGIAMDVGGGVLLFGGDTINGASNETWRWDGTTWMQVNPATVPAARGSPLMATDLGRGVVVMLGGAGPTGLLRDTWEWNGSQWLLHANAYGPVLGNAAMTFDLTRQVVSVCGVRTTTGIPPTSPQVEIHDWDGTAWNQIWSGSSQWPTSSHSYGFDPAVGRCVRIDGRTPFGGTFEFGPVQSLASSSWSGSGCTGVGFDLSGEGLYLGESAWIRLSPPPATTLVPVFVCLGASNRSWGSMSLPLDLTAYGLVGCRLNTSLDVVLHVGQGGNGFAPSLRLAVPLDPRLAGFEIHMQAIAVVPGINVAGLVLSDAETLRLGLR